MKINSLLSLVLGLGLFVFGCQNNDDTDGPDPIVIPPLTDEVEVYDPTIIHDNLVLGIENGGTTAYLLKKDGNKVFTWDFTANLGNDLELLPDGNVIGMFKSENPNFSFGGFGGIVKIIRPDGTTQWEYELATSEFIAHHDVEILPNGNVLFMVWERITAIEAQAAGVNVDYDIFPEKLIEVNPTNDTVVWEWSAWDHIIQDFDNTKLNFGDISNNPQLININYSLPDNGDIMHANGIDHDALKDIIYISVNFYSEVWVVDHSTTTAEAATSSGGTYNKGGNLLYRFGNPEVYNNTEGEKLFDRNHFPNLLEGDEPGAGNLLIYVNGRDAEQSTVYELDIPDTFNLAPNTNNEPAIVWSFTNTDLFNERISGAVRLSNGNTLICEGDYGYWEVTTNGEIAWKYNGEGSFWRGYAYDLDDSAISNLDL